LTFDQVQSSSVGFVFNFDNPVLTSFGRACGNLNVLNTDIEDCVIRRKVVCNKGVEQKKQIIFNLRLLLMVDIQDVWLQ